MPAKSLDTSITDATARRFLEESEERATLWCEKVPGLHLLKLKRGGSWRYRYTDLTGKRRVATIGGYPAMKPQEAAQAAREWRNAGTDPLREKQDQRTAAIHADELARQRTVETYLRGPYTRHQDRKKSGAKPSRSLSTTSRPGCTGTWRP